MTPIAALNSHGARVFQSLKSKEEGDTRTQISAPSLKMTQTNGSKDNSTTNKFLKHL